MVATSPQSSPWLFGPLPDLLLGCGLLYVVLFAVFAVGGAAVRDVQPGFLLPLLVLLLSTPHYGATLLRVYERREDRRSYFLFSLWASLAIFVAFAIASHVTGVAVFMVTLYLTWSPWHYTGQNYGIGVLFLRRRGIEVTPTLKRLLYASFILSYAVVLLVLHTGDGASSNVPVPYDVGGIAFQPIGIPPAVSAVAVPMLTVGYLASLAGWVTLLLRRATLKEIAPTLGLALTQALWFSIPFALWHWGLVSGIDAIDRSQRTYYFVWIALGHAVQYLWVTTYYARRSSGYRGLPRYWAKALAAGAAIWTLPVILFGPELLGQRDYDGGLALLVAATVNIHHFVLDGAIWKLRNHRIANILIRGAPVETDRGGELSESGSLRRLVWSAAAGCVAASVFVFWQSSFVKQSALIRDDLTATARILDRLSWFGRDSALERLNLARKFWTQGDEAQAIAQYERSVALRSSVDGYSALVRLRGHHQDWAAAIPVFEQALIRSPNDAALRFNAGVGWIQLNQPQRALAHLERATGLQPDSLRFRHKFEQAQRMLAVSAPPP